MSKYKILAVITIDRVNDSDDAVSALEHALSVWEEYKREYEGLERSEINISIKQVENQ